MTLEFNAERSLVLDQAHGHIIAKGVVIRCPVIALPLDSFFTIVDELYSLFQSGTALILEKVGEATGRTNAKLAMPPRGKIEVLKAVYNSASTWGYGRYELVRLDMASKEARIRIYDCAFARKSDVERRAMWYLVGFFKGYFSVFFEDDSVKCTEIKCASAGYDHCEFVVS